jgi:hypothetical protein
MEYNEAIAEFTRAIELRPDFAEAYNNRVYATYSKYDGTGDPPADNVLYLPADPRGYFGEVPNARAYVEQMEAAKNCPACLPAELNSEGHWGKPIAGLQSSIRFQTNVFGSGQPIDVRVTRCPQYPTSFSVASKSAGSGARGCVMVRAA